jgi:hypothetical protein
MKSVSLLAVQKKHASAASRLPTPPAWCMPGLQAATRRRALCRHFITECTPYGLDADAAAAKKD